MTTPWTKAHETELNRLLALREQAAKEPVVILGHTFVPMDQQDKECYAGAEEGTLICNELEHATLLWDPRRRVLSEMYGEGDCQRDWYFTQIVGE